MRKSIFGIEPSVIKRNFLTKNFDERYLESDRAFYISKETFHHDTDEGLSFDYKMCIESEYCEGNMFYSLSLVPMPSSLHSSCLFKVMDCSGLEDVNDVDVYDVFSYGYYLIFGSEMEEKRSKVNKSLMNLIANVYGTMNEMRGFYFDRCVNRVGTTGWMMLDEYIHGKSSWKATQEMLKKA